MNSEQVKKVEADKLNSGERVVKEIIDKFAGLMTTSKGINRALGNLAEFTLEMRGGKI